MGLFGQSCPLEKGHLPIYGVHSPRKWKKEDCKACEYQQDNKCVYKQVAAKLQSSAKYGYPALIKKSLMGKPAAQREQSEKEALKKAGFSQEYQTEYWTISHEYDIQWEAASEDQKREILDSLGQWKVHLEESLSPRQAHLKVQEWLRQRDEFRKQ
jgi:hypothetical protein